MKELRGNVDTRLRKLDDGYYDALVLAAAGLLRLGLAERISARISTDEMLPAVGQGALAVETRSDDADTLKVVTRLNHDETRIACLAERAFLEALGGGCQLPIAGFARVSQEELILEGLVASRDGTEIVRDTLSGARTDGESLGRRLAELLQDRGAARLLEESDK